MNFVYTDPLCKSAVHTELLHNQIHTKPLPNQIHCVNTQRWLVALLGQMKKLAIVAWMYFQKQLFALYDRKESQMGHPQPLEYHIS